MNARSRTALADKEEVSIYQLGIDLGTTYTAAAIYRDGRAEIVSLGSRAAVVPSVVFLGEDEAVLTGDSANRRAVSDPTRVAREFKRRVGDPTPILVGGTPLSAEALMAMMLRWTIDRVSEQEGGPPTCIGVSLPANWGKYKHDLLEQTIRLADLSHPFTTLSEPEAAATYYASTQRVAPGDLVGVYDLGGGTFDACVLAMRHDGFEFVGTPEGVEHLGGVDFDEAVFAHVIASLDGAVESLDQSDPGVIAALARLRQDCVDAKEGLSTDTEVSIPVLLPGAHSEVVMTREQFEGMIQTPIQQSIAALRRALDSAGIEAEDLSTILLVGGSSRIPLVAKLVSEAFGRPVAVDAHPKHAVALGCALAAGRAQERASGVSESAAVGVASPPHEPPKPRAEPAERPESHAGAGQKGRSASVGRRRLGLAAGVAALAAIIVGIVLLAGGGDDDGKDSLGGRKAARGAPLKGSWRALPDTPTPRQQVAATLAAGTVWIMGGLTGANATRAVEGYDPIINSWTRGPSLPVTLHHAMGVTFNDEIVVIGGWIPRGSDLTATSSDRAFALRGSKWVELPRLKHARAAGAAAVADGKIVVVGGQRDGKLVEETEVFDGKSWTDAAKMPTPREHLAAASDGKNVYAVGGRELGSDRNTAALERFDPSANAWKELADMPTPRGGLGAAVTGGRLYAVGGEEPTVALRTVEAFSISSGQWSVAPSLPGARHGLGVAARDKFVYAVDGAAEPGHVDSSRQAARLLAPSAQN